MFCSHCGTENPNNVYFCKNCGSELSRRKIDQISLDYQINVHIAILIGICTGVISGLFAAAITATLILPFWQWIIVFIISLMAISKLLWDSFNGLKRALESRMKCEK